MHAISVRQLVTDQIKHYGSKLEIVLFNTGSCCRPLST